MLAAFYKKSYFCKNYLIMTVVVKKGSGKKRLNELLQKMKYRKKLDAKRHLGKVKWNEDALKYQKRLRDEWD